MKKSTLILSALILSLGMTLIPINILTAQIISKDKMLPSLAPMLKKVISSIVSISVEGSMPVEPTDFKKSLNQYFDKPSFYQKNIWFFRSPFFLKNHDRENNDSSNNDQEWMFHTLGSGVIIDAKRGYIITNNHVIDNATTIQVKLNDHRQYQAQLIGNDPNADLALIQVKHAKNLRAIKIASSDNLRVGDYVVAIGNPYGLGGTVTSGIISGLGRSGLNDQDYENFIQTDAAINRGSSGGALVNLKGELIGINTAILAPKGGNIGIGFAIPSSIVRNLIQQILEYGDIQREKLGILGIEINGEIAKIMKLNRQSGTLITYVAPSSLAHKAGIKPSDIIIKINNKLVTNLPQLGSEISTLRLGSFIKLQLIRNNHFVTIVFKLQKTRIKKYLREIIYKGLEGARMSNFSNFGIKGVYVNHVEPNSNAEQVGLKKGDIILSANQHTVNGLLTLRRILNSTKTMIALNIQRGQQNLYLLIYK